MTRRMRRMSRRAAVVTAVVAAFAVVALPALAYWTFSVSRDTSFTAGSLPGSSVVVPPFSAGTVVVTWSAVTAPGGNAVDGYYVERTAGATTVAACATSPAALTTDLFCNDVAPAGSYTYRVTAVFRSWSTPAVSAAVLVDTTAPGAFSPALSDATGNTFVSGSTVYTNPQTGLSGGFTVTATPADGESGIKRVTFPTLAGYTSGGGVDSTSPYATTYAWSGAGATATGPQDVVAENNALTPTTGTFTVTPDTAVPTGGAVTVSNSTNGTVPVTSTAFTDAVSGMASNSLTRASSALSGNSCGTFTGSTGVSVSGGNDATTLATGCYQYTLTGTDRVGNQAVTTATAKVDTTAPTVTVTAAGASVTTDGTNVFFSAGAGSFTITMADADSGLGTQTFPTFTGWTQSGSGASRTYTLTTTSATGSGSAVATNGLGATTSRTIAILPGAYDIQGQVGNGKIDSGDVVKLTFNTVVSPSSILSGWNGSSTPVVFDPVHNATGDTASVTGTNLGTISLGGDYIQSGNGNDYALSATMTLTTVSGRSVVTITMTSSDSKAQTVNGNRTLSWATTANVKDTGNVAAATNTATESGSADVDF